MFEDAADFLPEDHEARPQPDRGLLRAGPGALVRRTSARRPSRPGPRDTGQQVQPWAKRCQELLELVAAGGEVPRRRLPDPSSSLHAPGTAAAQVQVGRVHRGRRGPIDAARPGPGAGGRPAVRAGPGSGARGLDRSASMVVPDAARCSTRSPAGRAPAWGAAIAIPGAARIVDPRRRAGASRSPPARAGPPGAARGGAGAGSRSGSTRGTPSWAAGEWDRMGVLELNLAVVRGAVPDLSASTRASAVRQAEAAYALAASAVVELARRNPTGTLDAAVREAGAGTGFEERLGTTGLHAGPVRARPGRRVSDGGTAWSSGWSPAAAGGSWWRSIVLGLVQLRRRTRPGPPGGPRRRVGGGPRSYAGGTELDPTRPS